MGLAIDRDTWNKATTLPPGRGYSLRESHSQPNRVLIHTTNNPKSPHTTFSGEAAYLAESAISSANYLVGRDGRIARILKPADFIAWHAGKCRGGFSNATAIGIEFHWTPAAGDMWPEAMLNAGSALVRELCMVYPIGDLRTHMETHRAVAVPAGRKSDPAGMNDMTFHLWRMELQCRREA